MKCKPKQHIYKIPPFSHIMHVFVRGQMYDVSMQRISFEEIMSLIENGINNNKEVTGLPAYYSTNDQKIIMYPVPDKEYEIIIRYAPSVREF